MKKHDAPTRGNWSNAYWYRYSQEKSDLVDEIFAEANRLHIDLDALAQRARLHYNTVWRLQQDLTRDPQYATIWKLARAVGMELKLRRQVAARKSA